MTVHLLIREDQNEHGFVDTAVVGVFRDLESAKAFEVEESRRARDSGLIVEDEDADPEALWQVSWSIEEHPVQ